MKGRNIRAFIDSNPDLQNSDYQGVPIISFDVYEKEYRDCLIVISVFLENKIREMLNRNQIPYFSAQMLPPEMVEEVYEDLFTIAERKVQPDGTLYLYGLNLYSVLLFKYFERNGRAVKIIPSAKEAGLWAAIKPNMGAECFCSLDKVGEAPLYITSNEYCMDKLPQRSTVNLYDFLYDIEAFYKPHLEKYRNLHQGKRCFIIGTGPSLRMDDLNKLEENGEITIGVNGVVRAYSSTKWRPTYYMINGRGALVAWGDELLGECRTEHMFMPDNIDYPHGGAFEIYHLSRLQADLHCPPPFTKDFSRGCYAFGVTHCALQFAAYMGFSEIYLYGMDFYYSRDYNYFTPNYRKSLDEAVERYGDAINNIYNRDMMISRAAYLSAKQAMEERGIKTYNATRRTWLDVFERVNFDRLFDD